MKMKLVRVTRKADADWKSYKDPVAVLKKDLDSFEKLCKEAKKKVDGLMDKGEWLKLDKANEFFSRAVITSRELRAEFDDAKVWAFRENNRKFFDDVLEIQKTFYEQEKKLNDITANLDLVGKRIAELKPAFSTIRKTYF